MRLESVHEFLEIDRTTTLTLILVVGVQPVGALDGQIDGITDTLDIFLCAQQWNRTDEQG